MIIKIGSHRFPGFYDTIFNCADDFFDDEFELQADLLDIVDDEKLEVCYEYENFDEYKKDVSKTYLEYVWKNSKNYPIWLANYVSQTSYENPYKIWQFTQTGIVNGINGYVDINIMYE